MSRYVKRRVVGALAVAAVFGLIEIGTRLVGGG